jgi:HEAT repeat protein
LQHYLKALEEIGDERAIAPLERLAATDSGNFSIMPNLQVSVREDARKAADKIRASVA